MPQEQKKAKPSLLRRIFGDAHIPNNWPELQKQWAGREIEYPEDAAKVNSISEMGPFSKWRYPDAYAVTGPLGNIYLNRKLIEKDKQDLSSVLSHELKHVGQGFGGFLRQMYDPNVENEAINREAMRPVRKDIHLPAERKKR